MSNLEVVNFVEKYRKICPKCQSFTRLKGGKITAATTNIAHFLCEEARYRWLGICEDEDVMIDDISCIIIELPTEPAAPKFDAIPDRSVGRTLSLCEKDDPSVYLRGKHVDSRGTLVDNEGPDALTADEDPKPRRGTTPKPLHPESPISGRLSKPVAARNDFLRGSIARDASLEEAKKPEESQP